MFVRIDHIPQSEDDYACPFPKFPKIPRLSRDIIITEKIDGSSGTIYVDDNGEILAGSKNRWITPQKDNHGFAEWVDAHRADLLILGPGWHRGEWWGQGINRGYGLKEKRFSLFNTIRWNENLFNKYKIEAWESFKSKEPRPLFVYPPACCRVVPILYEGPFEMEAIYGQLKELRELGSYAAPGYMNPEGVVIWHSVSGHLFKKTLFHDEKPKGVVEE